MKRTAFIIGILVMVLLMPVSIHAESYKVNDDELSVAFDDKDWVVFTRDNIKGNKQLKKLGTDYETMLATMEKSDSYLVAVKGGKKDRMEMQIRAISNPYINNMNTLSDEEMQALLKGVDENYSKDLDDYSSRTVELGDRRYIKMTGRYDKEDYDVVQYMTFVNGKNYLVFTQKNTSLSDEERRQIESIVESMEFREDPSLSENDVEAYVKDRQKALEGSKLSLPVKIAVTAAAVAAIILALWFKNRRRRR